MQNLIVYKQCLVKRFFFCCLFSAYVLLFVFSLSLVNNVDQIRVKTLPSTNLWRKYNNAVIRKVDTLASEEVILHFVKTVLLCGLKCYSLLKADVKSLDSVT